MAARPSSGSHFDMGAQKTLACLRVIRHVDCSPGRKDGNGDGDGDGDEDGAVLQEEEMLAFVPVGGSEGLQLDVERIGRWVAYCDNHHRGSCFRIEDPWWMMDTPGRLLFVDVEEECVTLQPGTSDYLTLSYVWGPDLSPLVAMKANIEGLCEAHSLAESSPLGTRLPRTIRDAMEVTRRLGYRFLWVDRLCIVQDDEATKPAHLASMAAIYGNSSITIIADNVGDDEGLPGVG